MRNLGAGTAFTPPERRAFPEDRRQRSVESASRGRGGRFRRRGVVTLARANLKPFGVYLNANLVDLAVGGPRGHISERILAAQFCPNVGERLRQIVHAIRKEGAPAAFLRKLLQNLVPFILHVFPVGQVAASFLIGK